MINKNQLKLFESRSLNPVYEIKRQIRLILSTTHLSRDQIPEKMNALSARENMPGRKISKDTIDAWCKDSEPSRLPSSLELMLFCYVMEDIGPLTALASPLGCKIIDEEEIKILNYGKADLLNRKTARKRRLLLEEVE